MQGRWPGLGTTGLDNMWFLQVRNLVRRPSLRLWSLWWVFNSTGYYLVIFYVHILWNKVYPATENKNVYNGGVEAASTLLGKEQMNQKNRKSN